MLGVLQSNLVDGPVYFNCYPNFSVDINDPNVMDSLTLNIERVIQFPDGSIELKFLNNPARRSSSNRRSFWSPSTSSPSRPVPRPPYSSKTPEEAEDDDIISVADNSKGKVTGVDFSGNVPKAALLQVKWNLPRRNQLSLECLRQVKPLSPIQTSYMNNGSILTIRIEIILSHYTLSLTNGTVIKASPFKEKSDKTGSSLTSADIDRVVEQNNYFNQILHIISRQIEDTKPTISGRPTPSSTSSSHNIETYPGFKIPEFSKEKFPKLSDTFEVTGNIIEKINAQLYNFNISAKDAKTPEKVSTLQEEPTSTQEKSNLLQKLPSSCFHNIKNYHNKPSFPDLQYEENAFLSTSYHERRSITEWNIDGLVEHQVYNKFHEMGVSITAYKMCGSADKDATNMIIAGFKGMLKHWWDNYVTDEIKQLIINATAMETIVKIEGNTQSTSQVTREDACATLLYHIAKHFIGEPKLFQDMSLQILSNLSCPNLDNFIHYKHAFLNKVRAKIQDHNNGSIPYSNLTYGDLVSTINVVALELCTDIKLEHQLKKEQSSSIKELGSFCKDFGFITPPDKIKKDKKEKSHRKKSRRRDDSTRPKKKKSRSKRPNDAKVDVCWACGKTGHKANECRSKTKKKKINLLNIDEETKGKLLAILDEPFSESSGTSDEYSDDEDIDLDYDSDKSQSGKYCICTEAFCTCDSTPVIRVLSDHSKEALFDVIQHIKDDEARNRFLLELKNILLNTDKPKPCSIIEPFSMKQIMNRLDNHSEPSISDLRHEVSSQRRD
ncbi:hypothetical protein KY290_024673 [Solanum tuberosum]|uniref:CCHC-type domain-containing protein n=1 Tax=Solanum tuberosum TaxID=4113 RepID=A0ABQ7UTD1_SOLTU|nr:hypothetical protein KY284_023521 [Solanum tuberosum]KAH0754403.1 hypothetical protein KY290_024673 [Solanum tuberosum]